MAIPLGTEVQVFVPDKDTIPNNPIKALNGNTYIVKKQKAITHNKITYNTYYELYGATSKKGVPYSFTEDDLIIL